MKRYFSILILVFAAGLFPVTAFADLMINPQRIVFSDRDRTADVGITNTSDEPAVFKLELYYLRQTETGTYEEVTEPLNKVFDPATAVVVSPKQVKLPANGQQRIRVSLRRPADLPPGEYRAHLRLKRIAQPQVKPPTVAGKITTAMTINIGFSIPLIVRQGVSDATASIGDIRLVPAVAKKPAFVEVTSSRSGNYGTMGTIKIFYTPPNGAETQIGTLNNYNIFPENVSRRSLIPLTQNNIPNGKLRIVYEGAGPDEGKVFDEKIFPVGG